MKPYAAELDRRQGTGFDWRIVRRFAKANLLGLSVPKEYGGMGVDHLTASIVTEELGAACLGISEPAGGTWLATTCLTLVGNEDQKKRYLPLVCGEKAMLAGLAVTEPEAGSDMAGIKTQAIKKGDRYHPQWDQGLYHQCRIWPAFTSSLPPPIPKSVRSDSMPLSWMAMPQV